MRRRRSSRVPRGTEIDEIDKLRPASPPKSVDSLFRNLNNTQPSAASEPGPTPPAVPPPNNNNSAPAKAVSSITTASHSSAGSAQIQPPADRQSALLSLLGSTVAPSCASSSATFAGNQPLIPPSPPSIKQRERRAGIVQSGNEAQGKLLLEQLMSSNIGNSGFGDPCQGSYPQSAPLPYPPQSYGPFPADDNQAQYIQEPPRDFQPQAPQAQPQPPSPSRKSHSRSAMRTAQRCEEQAREISRALRHARARGAGRGTLGDSGDGDVLHRMERAFALLETFRPNSRQDDASALAHDIAPPLLEAHFSILNCLLMLGKFAALTRTFGRAYRSSPIRPTLNSTSVSLQRMRATPFSSPMRALSHPHSSPTSPIDFITRNYAVYADLHFAYLEINPLIVLQSSQLIHSINLSGFIQ
ncbi:hypothetical protein DFH11DRAFT_1779812 [Phellopilus nigrolimitatus]|nr:hypothetical protein DFH11DRAFT_1779812 [Phellopilus nigrolimitatus]